MFGIKTFDDPIYQQALALVRCDGTEYEKNRQCRRLLLFIDDISYITKQDSEDILLRLEGKVRL